VPYPPDHVSNPVASAAATSANHDDPTGSASGIPPRWAVLTVTWVNSLGSGILWSGVPFVTERQYGFTQRENLSLALAQSVIYVAVALASGPLLRRLATGRGLSARGWIAAVFCFQMLASLVSLAGTAGVVFAACAISAAGAALWPVMESYVAAGQHGHDMRRSIGWFNVTWMSATGGALLVMAPLVASGNASLSLLAMVPVSLLSLAILPRFPAQPAPHPPEKAHTHIAPQYPFLLRATRFVVPTSYVFISALGPVLPFLLRDLHLDDGLKTPLASVWMFARMLTVMALSQAAFWHGRWSTLAIGVTLLAGGFTAVALAPSTAALVVGLAAFGAGHGIIYYAGLYYAMAVGGAEVDAGGRFEALIGVGYVIGPLAGFAGGASPGGLVTATCAAALLGLLPTAMPWLAWRRRHAAERRA
jgi:MFS family permease